jgi:hypothetical protein
MELVQEIFHSGLGHRALDNILGSRYIFICHSAGAATCEGLRVVVKSIIITCKVDDYSIHTTNNNTHDKILAPALHTRMVATSEAASTLGIPDMTNVSTINRKRSPQCPVGALIDTTFYPIQECM